MKKNLNDDVSLEQMMVLNQSDEFQILLNSIDESAVSNFLNSCQRATKSDPTRPILVFIDSYGGELYSMSSIISIMEATPNPIVTVCLGKAMSAGAFILSYGDVRFVTPHARIMIHQASSGAIGHIEDLKNSTDETLAENDYWMDFLAKQCKIRGGGKGLKKILDKAGKRDFYLSAEEALEFGIADYVGLPSVERYVEWQVSIDATQSKNK